MTWDSLPRRAAGSATPGRARLPSHPRPLGRAQELVLVARAARGDRDALNDLIAAHYPLAVRSAIAFSRRGVPVDDLVAEACIGIIEAVSRFDPLRGFRFMTHASWWIKRRVVEAVTHQSRNVRIPRHRFSAAAASAQSPPPREVPLSDAAGVAAGDTPGGISWPGSLDRHVLDLERSVAVRGAVASLPERERLVLDLRHGFTTGDERTLASIALELGISKERVRQIEGRAVGRLRQQLTGFH